MTHSVGEGCSAGSGELCHHVFTLRLVHCTDLEKAGTSGTLPRPQSRHHISPLIMGSTPTQMWSLEQRCRLLLGGPGWTVRRKKAFSFSLYEAHDPGLRQLAMEELLQGLKSALPNSCMHSLMLCSYSTTATAFGLAPGRSGMISTEKEACPVSKHWHRNQQHREKDKTQTRCK